MKKTRKLEAIYFDERGSMPELIAEPIADIASHMEGKRPNEFTGSIEIKSVNSIGKSKSKRKLYDTFNVIVKGSKDIATFEAEMDIADFSKFESREYFGLVGFKQSGPLTLVTPLTKRK